MFSSRVAHMVVGLVFVMLVVVGMLLLLAGINCLNNRDNRYNNYRNGYIDKPSNGVVKIAN